MADHVPAAAREAARATAQAKLAGLFPGQTGISVASEIADAILEAAWSNAGIPDKAKCPVCNRTYRTRADGQVRRHYAPHDVKYCAGSPEEAA